MGTLRALLPVRMSFSCSGRMTCQSSGARPSVMLARTILRSGSDMIRSQGCRGGLNAGGHHGPQLLCRALACSSV